jgi:paraquat-inducible protein B
MSKKANPTTIGMFIVIGLVLAVAGLILFSSGKLFSPQHRFILYFNASLKGLNPGAPVKLRGVTIGSVVEVLISHNQATNDYSMPVIIDIDQKLLQARSDRALEAGNQERFEALVQRGLRGRLDAESLVTGVLYVELEVVPQAPPPVFHQLQPEYPEIPTLPTTIQELISNLASFDLKGLSEKLNALLTRLDTTISQLNVPELNRGLTNLIASLDRVVGSPDLTNSLAGLRLALEDVRALVRRLDSRVDPLADSVTNTLAQAQQTLAQMRQGVEQLGGLVAPDAPLQNNLNTALDELARAARAIADLAQFLERHPNALITGKKISPAKP